MAFLTEARKLEYTVCSIKSQGLEIATPRSRTSNSRRHSVASYLISGVQTRLQSSLESMFFARQVAVDLSFVIPVMLIFSGITIFSSVNCTDQVFIGFCAFSPVFNTNTNIHSYCYV